jgi:hypothetical protein
MRGQLTPLLGGLLTSEPARSNASRCSVTAAFFVWDLFFDPRKRVSTMKRFTFIVATVLLASGPVQAQRGYDYWYWGNNDWGSYCRPGCMRITEITPVLVEALKQPGVKSPAGVKPPQPGVKPQPANPKAGKAKDKAAPGDPDQPQHQSQLRDSPGQGPFVSVRRKLLHPQRRRPSPAAASHGPRRRCQRPRVECLARGGPQAA